MSAYIDLTNQTFGKLKVIKLSHTNNTHAFFVCKCECGNKVVVSSSNLKSKNTKSCAKGQCRARYAHGMAKTKFYRRWSALKERQKENISKEWQLFQTFYDDTYPTFKSHYSLRIIDKNKVYSKENCYWSIPSEKRQIINKRIYFS